MTIETQSPEETRKEVMSELVRVCELMWVRETTGGRPDVAAEYRRHCSKIKNEYDPELYPIPEDVEV